MYIRIFERLGEQIILERRIPEFLSVRNLILNKGLLYFLMANNPSFCVLNIGTKKLLCLSQNEAIQRQEK